MESLSKQELISTITKQADQIKRYEARLRDVVAAYKGLVKEKEALEISLKALNKTDDDGSGAGSPDSIAALTLSLSTLTAEKNRMEEVFQADKKVTREKYENMLASMREETKSLVQQHLAEVANLKTKIAYEIQEREKERADHAAMLKELHLKLNTERKNKEKLEDKVVQNTESEASQADLEKRVRDLSGYLEASQRRLMRAEARTAETPALLVRLQQKLALLEQTHAVAIREEQIKAKRAEESARKICARQEERVALLEGKVAELSQTIGEYDMMRRRDQNTIQQLRESFNGRLLEKIASNGSDGTDGDNDETQKSETDNEKLADSEYLQTLIDKIHILKKELLAENEKVGSPVDITTVFKVDGYDDIHRKCREEYDNLKIEYDNYKFLNVKVTGGDESETEDLKSEIAILKEKVDTYVLLLEEEKQVKAELLRLHEEKLRAEKEYHKEVTSDLKNRIQSLEKQVQTQRERYATLLEETDSYIRSRHDRSRKVSKEDGWKDEHVINDGMSPHMLHYAHELARRDLDITQLRREKHALEGLHRDCQREATIEKERYKEVVRTLREEIDRLRRTQSREGANLEYLKNVVISYLMSSDYVGRRHMLNAIAAVLHFTDNERKAVLSTL
ncbi:GRIP and coiled-coil domain-containing protein 1 [Danaus plexippus]|uniref:GRIP and coiled-coil domain-containing protein 1 n=1 Tax=Danaus plexippus TaxID=13037 RepID=UPI002AB0DB3D|nr:GRIP and coiled-coil domain-containing protein 1 [Danaus plexippus]